MATYVGIEQDSLSVRAAIVRSQLGRTQIVKYVELWLSQFPMGNVELVDPSSTEPQAPAPALGSPARQAIAEILRLAGSGAEVIAAMPTEDVSLRRVELPMAAARKVDELLPFEIESLIPFETDATQLEHQTIESGDPTKLHLLVCAAPKAKIRQRLDQLAEVGLDPMALVPSAPALAGLSTFLASFAVTEAPQMLVTILVDRTEIAIVRRGKCELARTITAGHRQVEEIGYAEPQPGSEAERLARELRQTITSYRMQGGTEPEGTWALGLIDPSAMIVRWLGHVLSKNVELFAMPDVAAGTSKTIEAPLDPVAKARFAIPLGLVGHVLARQRIDLRKGEFVRTRQLGLARELAPLLGIAAMAIFFSWGFSVYAQYSVLRARREVLESELARISLTHLGQETVDVTEARELLEQGRANPDPMPQWTAFDALLAISNAIPGGETGGITHDVQRLQIDLAQDRSEGHFELQGVVGTIEESDRVRAALAEIPCFQNLEQAGATTPAADGRRQYRLEADIRCPDERRASDDTGRRRGRRSGGAAAAAQGGE
ncbi:MAG: pilus assembly protein PilM [Deltaproteobacteria bacterium]|nr:pilus assembly protein PilM [Deltaproteobacteria bacterium]